VIRLNNDPKILQKLKKTSHKFLVGRKCEIWPPVACIFERKQHIGNRKQACEAA